MRRDGDRDVVEIADAAPATASRREVMPARATTAPRESCSFVSLDQVAADRWRALVENAIEPNGYYLPEWESAVNAFATGRSDADALVATDGASRMIGLMPVMSAWRVYKLPMPVLVTADPYSTLATPLLDRDAADDAVTQLMQNARDAGAHALVLRDTPIEGAALSAFTRALGRDGLRPQILNSHARACLDATRDADDLLRDALGPKKLKELRRQRNRLAEHGEVIFSIATEPAEIERALETFLDLEASGWKAKRGTALKQDTGDAAFIRRAVMAMAARGNCEVITLHAGDTPVASAVVLRHLDRAFYYKLGVDERFAKLSPGVQLTLELTRHLCADASIAMADSTAAPGHPMIDPIWRGRLSIGDVLIPLYRRDPLIPAIRLALAARNWVREPARRIVHFMRQLREKKS
jgi:CelD/BcsL family acetyltransferase involved in cellulose biosynthesis